MSMTGASRARCIRPDVIPHAAGVALSLSLSLSLSRARAWTAKAYHVKGTMERTLKV